MIFSSDDEDYDEYANSRAAQKRIAEARAEYEAQEERNTHELLEITAKIEEIDQKLKKLEEKYKDKTIEFNGYRNLKPLARHAPDGSLVIEEPPNSELKKVVKSWQLVFKKRTYGQIVTVYSII